MTVIATDPVLDAFPADSVILARSGALTAKISHRPEDIEAAQRLRFDVFYREMGAHPTPEMAASERDFDRYDSFCDHLLVTDGDDGDAVVGCYRLLRRAVADEHGGFYSAGEYDIAPLLEPGSPFTRTLELGRSCVAKAYRSSAVMQFMWRGLVAYLDLHKIDLMFGCASLHGVDPAELKLELSYLHHFHGVPPELPGVKALGKLYVPMDLMPKESIDVHEAQRALPPLVKGYVRFGSYIGDGAVIDEQFNTTDVFIYFPTDRLDKRLRAFLTRGRQAG